MLKVKVLKALLKIQATSKKKEICQFIYIPHILEDSDTAKIDKS